MEFSSERKRVSVIIKDKYNKIRLLCKGADSAIQDLLLKETDNLEAFNYTKTILTSYAEQGLRTLVFAEKEIS